MQENVIFIEIELTSMKNYVRNITPVLQAKYIA